MLLLLTGGARSGKSRAAVEVARAGATDVTLVATAEPGDGEMAARIARHQAERPEGWTVVEAPVEVAHVVRSADPAAVLIIDCLSLWVANRLDCSDEDILAAADDVIAAVADRRGLTIVVTNEVGSGIVPDNPVARRFRDLLGLVNQSFALAADRAHLCVAGRLLDLAQPAAIDV